MTTDVRPTEESKDKALKHLRQLHSDLETRFANLKSIREELKKNGAHTVNGPVTFSVSIEGGALTAELTWENDQKTLVFEGVSAGLQVKPFDGTGVGAYIYTAQQTTGTEPSFSIVRASSAAKAVEITWYNGGSPIGTVLVPTTAVGMGASYGTGKWRSK
ncbi:hypothetical protein [Streptomyces sp. URMC 129]|uniref:hypothetical protein n=1 Tax=Streptomyces sp. URMC 129 TaxID=3423407 RepID=UPI003F1B81C6